MNDTIKSPLTKPTGTSLEISLGRPFEVISGVSSDGDEDCAMVKLLSDLQQSC